MRTRSTYGNPGLHWASSIPPRQYAEERPSLAPHNTGVPLGQPPTLAEFPPINAPYGVGVELSMIAPYLRTRSRSRQASK